MNQKAENPFSSPAANTAEPADVGTADRLLFLWIWLGFSAVLPFLAVPADERSMLVALAVVLISFAVGAVLGSSLPFWIRVMPVVFWIIPGLWLAFSFRHPTIVTGAILYALLSIVSVAWISRSIQQGRFRILTSFCAGFLVGSIVPVIGTILGAVFATMLAVRSCKHNKTERVQQQ